MLRRSAEAAFWASCAIWLLCLPWRASLWLDELVSYWVIKDGLRETWARAVTFQGQSPLYYSILWVWTRLFGISELALRLPSVLCALGSGFLLYKIGRQFFDRSTALTAVVLFFSVNSLVIASISARPYSLALLFFLAATLVLLTGTGRSSAIAYGTLMLGSYYAHYLFIFGAGAQLLLIIFCRPRQLANFMLALLLVAIFAIPGALQIKTLSTQAELSFAPYPSFGGFFTAAFPVATLVVWFAAIVAGYFFGSGRLSTERINPMLLLLFLLWCICGPLIFLAVSNLHHGSLFLERYFLWSAAGLALGLAATVTIMAQERDRWIVLLICAVLAGYFASARHFIFEDWRSAAAVVRERLDSNSSSSVLISSGLIEARSAEFYTSSERQDYLRSPLSYYAAGAAGTALPPNLEEGKFSAYLQEHIAPMLGAQQEFYVLAREPRADGPSLEERYAQFFAQAGFESQRLGDFGEVIALRFTRPGKAQEQN